MQYQSIRCSRNWKYRKSQRINKQIIKSIPCRLKLQVLKQKIRYYIQKQKKRSLDQWTALHIAISEKNNEIAELLIQNGANIESETSFKRRPIHIACITENIEGIEILIKHKADINALDANNNSALIIACEKQLEKAVEILLENNADFTIENLNGISVQKMFLQESIYQIFQKYNINILKKENINTNNKKNNKIKKFRSVKDYDYYKILGTGSFGKVLLVKDKQNNKFYAMKIISKEKFQQMNLMKYAIQEKNSMAKMNHPFIVKFHHSFQSKSKLFIIQQYCGGGSLGRMLKQYKKFEEETVKKYATQLILAIEALHENLIIFRDLKPDNIVLDEEGNAHLIDFGLAKIGVYDQINQSFLGTPAYISPEIVLKMGHNRMTDWYSLGIVIYELLFGFTPFNQGNVSRDTLYERIKSNKITFPTQISKNCQDIIKKLLDKNLQNRIGYKGDGKEIKSHEWFSDVDWNKVLQKKIIMPKPPIRQIPTYPLEVNFNEDCDQEFKISCWTQNNLIE
ncbi:protein kinase domain protein [Ichthyophthirius multifiliis]|uniref:Protein kinase domain protein n=1 Tax=Ichthyophthirius multifiliis TaxID=5932 RepID=G0QL14_ICHMU|nr:protein kinase domain protein [Ichthyophthirius multifiliis]EGR34093.1 protein kinase domain protein [Ichthyophthirius multifiliis]|eukprot:XP_004039397.1 protein kinase domain protein [Ichthyophthirius multifiliis]